MCIFILCLNFQSFAQGDLLVTPTRVVFEGTKKKQELNLVNMGTETATYSISFIQKNMNEDGSFIDIEQPDSGQYFADPYLRIFPRQVTLAPQESQVIMLQYRPKPDMLAGEYRSHLYFRSEKDYSPLGQKKIAKDSTLLSVQLTPIFGMTIPVIIRSGNVSVTASLNDLKLEVQNKTIQKLKLSIHRTGNISIYGDIRVYFIPREGKPNEIGAVNGVGVYSNINKRNITMRLDKILGDMQAKGKLRVSYISNSDGKRIVYAESELEIN
jgi:P pilus assembly chaperone PapD